MAKRSKILSIPMEENDAGAETIGEYLEQLLLHLWEEKEGFSGKRPFGNSGWEYDLYLPLVQQGIVKGEVDEDGCLLEVDEERANTLVSLAIMSLFNN